MKTHPELVCWHIKNQNNQTPKYRNQETRFKQSISFLCFETNNKFIAKDVSNEKLSDVITGTTSQMNNLVFLDTKPGKETWIIDSGSSSHIINDNGSYLLKLKTQMKPMLLRYCANGKTLHLTTQAT